MRKTLFLALLGLTLTAWFKPVASQAATEPVLFDNYTLGSSMKTVRTIGGGLTIVNYSKGENNSDRYIKLFVNNTKTSTWTEVTNHNLPTTQLNVATLQRFGSKIYAVVNYDDKVEVWQSKVNRLTVWEKVATFSGNYSDARLTRFQQQLYLLSSSIDGQLQGWTLKFNGDLTEQSITIPFEGYNLIMPHAVFTLNHTLFALIQVDNTYTLVSSTDGSTFTSVDSYPVTQESQPAEVVKIKSQAFLTANASNKATIWSSTDGETWNKLGQFASTDTMWYEIDVVGYDQAVPKLLVQKTTTADQAHPSIIFYQYTNGAFEKVEQWDNVKGDNAMVRFKSHLHLLLNTGDGQADVTL